MAGKLPKKKIKPTNWLKQIGWSKSKFRSYRIACGFEGKPLAYAKAKRALSA